MLARPRETLVKVVGAVIAREPGTAIALIRAGQVPANTVVAQPLILGAFVNVLGAGSACPAGGAIAPEAGAARKVGARAAVNARRVGASVDFLSAIRPRESWTASAFVTGY